MNILFCFKIVNVISFTAKQILKFFINRRHISEIYNARSKFLHHHFSWMKLSSSTTNIPISVHDILSPTPSSFRVARMIGRQINTIVIRIRVMFNVPTYNWMKEVFHVVVIEFVENHVCCFYSRAAE